MKALVLAGGYATRLWPVTKNRSKPLLPLAGKPIISYTLDELEATEKVDRIYIATNEKFEDEFINFLATRENSYELIVESQKKEEEKYGAIGGIINVIKKKEDDDYVVIGGDNYYSFDLQDFLQFSSEKGTVTNACYQLATLEEAKNYGIVDVDEEGRIVEFQEKPEKPRSRIASTACYYFPKKYLNLFNEYMDYWEGKVPKNEYLDEPGRFMQWLVNRYPSHAYMFKGQWMDIGTREGYLRAMEELKNENTVEGSVENSELGQNVTVLEGCEIKNSEIENSVIFENCKIVDSVVKHSLVGDNTHLKKKDLRSGVFKDLE
ncbi:MAG: sugar phosphate nucleotidyltransferase [Candidatus Aenigmatarchaeota archaeon]